MERREYLAVLGCGLTGSVAGCIGGSGATDVDGEFFEDELSAEVRHRRTLVRVHRGDVTVLRGCRNGQPLDRAARNRKDTANFLDSDGTRITDHYDPLTDLPSDQPAEFTVRYSGDDADRVGSYELIVDIPNPS